jgi:hypothetical protein
MLVLIKLFHLAKTAECICSPPFKVLLQPYTRIHNGNDNHATEKLFISTSVVQLNYVILHFSHLHVAMQKRNRVLLKAIIRSAIDLYVSSTLLIYRFLIIEGMCISVCIIYSTA